MSPTERVNDLAERKRLLVLEADLHRHIIGLECTALQARAAALTDVRKQLAARSPWVIGSGAAAGLLAVRHWRKVIRWAPQVFSLWRLIKK